LKHHGQDVDSRGWFFKRCGVYESTSNVGSTPREGGIFISYWLIAANSDPTSWKCRVVRVSIDVLKSRYRMGLRWGVGSVEKGHVFSYWSNAANSDWIYPTSREV
jgi:hypothetical protein